MSGQRSMLQTRAQELGISPKTLRVAELLSRGGGMNTPPTADPMAHNSPVLAELAALAVEKAKLEGRIADLAKRLVCGCCGGSNGVGLHRLMTKAYPTCADCVFVWYDGAGTDGERVKAESLKRQGRAA